MGPGWLNPNAEGRRRFWPQGWERSSGRQARLGGGEELLLCVAGEGREWLWDWDLPAFLGWGIGKGMPWVTPLPCHGSQSTCIQVTPSQLF